MSTENSTSEYLLLFRGNDWTNALSPAELQEAMTQVRQWFEGLGSRGIMKAAQPLLNEGRIISSKSGAVADGPFVESKEAVGGYLIVKTDTLDEAVAIARQCPMLQYGGSVEVRPIAEECPKMKELGLSIQKELAGATA